MEFRQTGLRIIFSLNLYLSSGVTGYLKDLLMAVLTNCCNFKYQSVHLVFNASSLIFLVTGHKLVLKTMGRVAIIPPGTLKV